MGDYATGPAMLAGRSGRVPKLELHCSLWGYGVLIRRVPERCPMCSETRWALPAWPHCAVASSG